MKVLVVDDEGIVLNSCRRILCAEGWEVQEAVSVDEALEMLEGPSETSPQLLLVDVKMPEHDGMYLLEKVKAKKVQLPVVIMTGYATAETINRAEILGAAKIIAKPFTPEELMDTLLSVVGKENTHE